MPGCLPTPLQHVKEMGKAAGDIVKEGLTAPTPSGIKDMVYGKH